MLAFDLGRVMAGRGQSKMVDFERELFDMVGLGLNRIEVIKGCRVWSGIGGDLSHSVVG